MHAKIFSATTIGVDAKEVQVEVDIALGLINFFIVGLPDMAIKESRQRISTALKNSGIRLPDRKITVNLAPADLKKEGTLFDLPIAVGILQATGLINLEKNFIEDTLFLGELSLDGTVRPIKGALAITFDSKEYLNKKRIVLPKENTQEASLITDIEIIGIKTLTEFIAYARKERNIIPTPSTWHHLVQQKQQYLIDFSQVKGQKQAKRALQIAAAGRHNILFIGSPGAGKTMLAQRLPTIMPPLTFKEILETSKIYSITGKLSNQQALIYQRPFRAPHHTISEAGLVGGGTYPQPGEISLAHNGILFLDELTEFKRHTLEVLRQPLENKNVSIARANQTITFPASILLVAALNPCPCGFLGDKKRPCTCKQNDIYRYLQKLSGPLLDRIDLQIHVQAIDYDDIKKQPSENSSEKLYNQIKIALEQQEKRFGPHRFNNSMTTDEVEKYCILEDAAENALKQAFERLSLSMRGYHKILKIGRTIADLDQKETISLSHIQEAITYRSLENTLDKLKTQ
ncbi:TPA: hypothetical protein DIC20_03370 [Candidatus Dependentiae bacterium]|nr:MAG: hypothetical protein US03_C0001G0064 [candidate division TM6 bacterium GW2011_GWF2_36_131]KKQ03800.1 MAG: hypothetical protein US13_C0001G0140 [candidate division TM6 bacterium GW2011_GWE2_36_25]KKQ19946.1 MAG: hypothetical protein US32_C0003G0063 [candidate division TM6 bacterium GW2011_GWA2_36_9]HBR70568.1 hypothetical protein [Candidatus Dependentiae bacterium]HCU00716.1 hypothetical protein [Candidatus Dependentiae bacterium]